MEVERIVSGCGVAHSVGHASRLIIYERNAVCLFWEATIRKYWVGVIAEAIADDKILLES
ncbi:hypothetical protein KTH_28800 [Thermosporothrix hazakensis]|jgi:hypothetical protein|nr:hypothetical protein KTH_28800 [Thermosporothrix hazakensis]